MQNESLAERRRAMIIGLSEYDKPLESLPFCKKDGEELYEVLKSLGYQIADNNKLIGRVKGNQIRDAIYDFFSDETINSQDTILFYYSGHGIPDADGDVYLASSEINPKKPYKNGFSFGELTKMMNRSNSTRVVTILDCCYSGAAKVSKGNEDDASTIGTAAIENKSRLLKQGEGKCILSASQAFQEAYGKKTGDHSIFTYYLLQGLKKNEKAVDVNGNVTVDTLGTYLYDTLVNLPSDKRPNQKPVRKVEAGGTIVLASFPTLGTFWQSDKSDYSKEISEIMDIMRKARYDKALSDITSSKYYNIVPRFSYLEACCRSMLSEESSDRNQENIEKGFQALATAIENDFLGQMKREFLYSNYIAIAKIVDDTELDYLKEIDLSRFCKSIKITERKYHSIKARRAGCLVASTAVRDAAGVTKPISMISIGDSVLVANEPAKTGIVPDKFCKKEDWLVRINNKITVSHGQRFLTTQGFKKAADLKEGDMLRTFDEPEPIITLNHLHTPMDVYMISLSSGHIFYAEDFIVHNTK